MTAYLCPDCGAERQRDGRPGCACAARAAAAAEDFDPLRIRPYVELREPVAAPEPEQSPAFTDALSEAGASAPRAAGGSGPDPSAPGSAASPGPAAASEPASAQEPERGPASPPAPGRAPERTAGGAPGPGIAAAPAPPSVAAPPSAHPPAPGPAPAAVPGSGAGWDTLFSSPPAGPAPGSTGGPGGQAAPDGTGAPGASGAGGATGSTGGGPGSPGDGTAPGSGRHTPDTAVSPSGTAPRQPADHPAAPTSALPRFDGTASPAGEAGAPDATRPLSPLAAAVAAANGPDSRPRAEDLGLFHEDLPPDGTPEDARNAGPDRPGRRRRTAVIAGAAAVVAAVCVGAFATGLLGGDEEDRVAPNENSATPTAVLPTDDGEASPSGSSSPSASASASGSPSASATEASTGASPSGTAGSAAPDGGTPEPTRASGSVSVSPGEPGDGQGEPPVLRKGMSGPEVLEMQQRLNQVGLFTSVDEDGAYDDEDERAIDNYQRWNGVKGDPSGVYGPETRSSLESRTEEP
ncbi:peptidoglycan-binding domain-containing protein [Streptomyces albus]|uniref:peptidoglycan-binding domain-containing protein n=1 Tax=Streptomyces albus TaxID=1888 RepID=UPI00068F8274|nr:peptidoglycan-binding domain-containing protein [Streptomyces albus]